MPTSITNPRYLSSGSAFKWRSSIKVNKNNQGYTRSSWSVPFVKASGTWHHRPLDAIGNQLSKRAVIWLGCQYQWLLEDSLLGSSGAAVPANACAAPAPKSQSSKNSGAIWGSFQIPQLPGTEKGSQWLSISSEIIIFYSAAIQVTFLHNKPQRRLLK